MRERERDREEKERERGMETVTYAHEEIEVIGKEILFYR